MRAIEISLPGFAVTEYHSLFILKRHVLNYFELTQVEVNTFSEDLSLWNR